MSDRPKPIRDDFETAMLQGEGAAEAARRRARRRGRRWTIAVRPTDPHPGLPTGWVVDLYDDRGWRRTISCLTKGQAWTKDVALDVARAEQHRLAVDGRKPPLLGRR